MGDAEIKVKIDVDLDKLAIEQIDKVKKVADYYAPKMESYGKKNAPWTDKTTNARNSIKGVRRDDSDNITVGVSGNVSYFKFLEFAHGKKWAILKPTIDKFTPEILEKIKKVLGDK